MSNQENSLNRQLKLIHVVVLGLAYMSPFAVFDTFGIVSDITSGHVPIAYIVVFTAILFTALSYGKMVKIYPVSGSVYTYTQRIINKNLGFLAGWITFLAYLALPMINALLARIYLSAGIPSVPGWVWIVLLLLIITLVNLIGTKVTASVNLILVVFQFLTGIVFVALTIRSILMEKPNQLFSPNTLISESLDINTLFAGASLLALAFIGFDAITTLSEETINPKKTIPRGIILVAVIGGVFFFTVTYFMQTLFPNVSTFNDIEGASPEIAAIIGGNLFLAIFTAGALTSVFASGLAAQTSASRLLYAMGRDNVLPKKFFGYVHPKTKTPVFNIILIAVLGLSSIFINLETATSLINFGAFFAFSIVNICVIVNFVKNHKDKKLRSVITNIIFPSLGLSFVLYLWVSLNWYAIAFGIGWSLLGVIYLFVLTRGFQQDPPQVNFDELEG